MGLDNFWVKPKTWDEDTQEVSEYENVAYMGDDLPCEFLKEGLKVNGYFRGKVFSDLFDALIEYVGTSLYCHDGNMSSSEIFFCYERMIDVKEKLLADDGELWLESFKNEHLRDSSYVEHYDYELVLSFILMWEWYAQVEDIELASWW